MQRFFRYLLPLLLLLVVGVGEVRSQSVAGNAQGFPVPFGPTNAGRDFWLAFPSNWDLPGSTAYYIRLYITSGVRTEVKVWVGAGIKKVITTIPNKIVTVDLLPIEAQMLVRADQPPVPPDRIFKNKAVHVRAGAPIVVYGMNRTTFTSDGLLAFPTNALGREYVIASYGAVIGVTQELPSQYMIIAPYNGTTVQIYHPHRTPNHTAGETFTINLDSGDVWSAMTVGYNGDMSGAVIKANKPVAVTAGQACTYIPNLLNFCCCDHIEEMMLPTSSWGKIYHGTPFQTRLKGDFYRVFAKEPNTKVSVNGEEYATLTSVGGEEGIGWFEYRALGRFPVEFSADKPIYVSQYNTSQAYDGVPSDPFFLVLTPLEQYQKALIFCTPAADFPQNFFNITCEEAGYQDIEITEAGENRWRPVASLAGAGVPQRYPTMINGKRYITVTIDLEPGTYQMRATTPFAGYIYGFSNYDSYGYPVSVAAGDLTKADKDPPVFTVKQDCEGNVDVTVRDMPNEDEDRTNLATIELDPDPSVTENYELIVTPFEAGVSRQTTYRLRVLDKSKPGRALVILSDMAGNVSTQEVIYNPLNVSLQPTPTDFGKLRAGSSDTRTLKLTNNSDNEVTIKEVLLKSGVQNFEILSPKGEFKIPAKGSVDVEVRFTADLKGRTKGLIVYDDSVGVRDECGLRYMALVKGQVVKPVIDVTDHDFGSIPVGVTSGNWTMEVRNISEIEGSSLTVTARTGPVTGPNEIFKDNGTDVNPTFTLEPGQSRTIQFTARPLVATEYNDTVHISSDAMEGDSIGWLKVRGIEGKVYATSYNWGRRRMMYSYTNERVYVHNIGDAAVRLNTLAIEAGADADQFRIVNPLQVTNRTLNPQDSIEVIVEFNPTSVGDKKARIVYTIDPVQSNEVVSELSGFGTRPELFTTDYNFGNMNVGDPTVPYNGTEPIAFWTPSNIEFDSVTITGFQWDSDNFGGNDDFRNAPINLTTPVVLHAGERFEFNGWFDARTAGVRTARLRAITADHDAARGLLVDTTSNWRGVGTSQDAQIALQATTLPPLCVGEEGIIDVTISNPGEAPLTVTGLAVDNGQFQIIDPVDPTQTFTVMPGTPVVVRIRYTAQRGTQNANLNVSNTATGVAVQAISGTGLQENWNTKLVLTGVGSSAPSKAALGKTINAELWLDQNFNGMPTGMNMTTYTVTMKYNPKKLRPVLPVQKGAGTGGAGTINPLTNDQKNGILTFEVTGFMASKASALVSLPFSVLFDAELSREIIVESITSNANCLVVNGTSQTIEVEPICGLNLRMITLNENQYTLDQNKPNPFNPVTRIQYTLGLDGPTQLNLYNASGDLVQVLVNEHQVPGRYELTLDVSNLASGNYYYTIVSGDWKETKMLTVVK